MFGFLYPLLMLRIIVTLKYIYHRVRINDVFLRIIGHYLEQLFYILMNGFTCYKKPNTRAIIPLLPLTHWIWLSKKIKNNRSSIQPYVFTTQQLHSRRIILHGTSNWQILNFNPEDEKLETLYRYLLKMTVWSPTIFLIPIRGLVLIQFQKLVSIETLFLNYNSAELKSTKLM